jgi:peroxiredoxin
MKKVKVLAVVLMATVILFSSFSLSIQGSTDYSKAEIEITARKYLLKVNGQPIKLDISPIWDSETQNLLVPLRVFSDLLGYEIKWDPTINTALFRKKDIYFEINLQSPKIILKSSLPLQNGQIILKSNRLLMDSKTITTLYKLKSSLDMDNFMVTFFTDRSQIHMVAPDFNLKDISGGKFHLFETLQNKKYQFVVINFYATRCPVCAKALPNLEKFYEEYKSKGILVVGINTDTQNMEDQRDAVIAKYHLTYPILLDVDASVYSLYSVSGIPNLFIINTNKEIVQHQLGVNDEYFSYLRSFIDSAIQK